MLTTAQIIKKYGEPDEAGSYLATIDLPYPMRIAWDKKQSVRKMRCHKLVAENFKRVFSELLATYGLLELQRLEIDIFGGCFAYRKMRGGSDWSRHSWGIAIDLNPAKNGLKTKVINSQFAKPEYNKMMGIFERNGFINLGKIKGIDTMHFEISN